MIELNLNISDMINRHDRVQMQINANFTFNKLIEGGMDEKLAKFAVEQIFKDGHKSGYLEGSNMIDIETNTFSRKDQE